MPKFEPTFNLGQVIVAVSFTLSGSLATLGFVFGTRADIVVLKYQLNANEIADVARAKAADNFRGEAISELRAIREEITKLRLELQEKEPRKR